jgi:hypothetical protein
MCDLSSPDHGTKLDLGQMYGFVSVNAMRTSIVASLIISPAVSWTSAPQLSTRRSLLVRGTSALVLMAESSSSSASSSPSGATTTGAIQKAEIVGGGRIGSLLAEAGNCVLLGRGDLISSTDEGNPILVATRNDALDGIVDNCPPNRLDDLVFLQNGYLDLYLGGKGLAESTQALLYLSVTAKGAPAIDGVTAVNPEGLTAATGKHARAFADRLAALNLKCNVLSSQQYQPAMFEKLMYVAVTRCSARGSPRFVSLLPTLFSRETVGSRRTCSWGPRRGVVR